MPRKVAVDNSFIESQLCKRLRKFLKNILNGVLPKARRVFNAIAPFFQNIAQQLFLTAISFYHIEQNTSHKGGDT